MLYVSLTTSVVMLLIVNVLARCRQSSAFTISGWWTAALVSPLFLLCGISGVMIQTLLLGLGTIVWLALRRDPSSYLRFSLSATAVAYIITGVIVWKGEREYAQLRALYPFESMETRLPAPTKPASLHAEASQRLIRLDATDRASWGAIRAERLWMLHNESVSLFINAPGFGPIRMLRPSEGTLATRSKYESVPAQPGARFASFWSPGELRPPLPEVQEPLNRMLDASILDFVHPEGFGYFKDRRHVAGFESHRFSRVPEPANEWKVQSIELVSLLLHDDPVAYVSTELPRMDELDARPTRPLDRFESFGLQTLRQGDDVFIDQAQEGLRMLGAVRSLRQCVACHEGEPGALLGAFSYTLRSESP